MKKFLYFAEDPVETGGAGSNPEAILVPVDSYLGCDPISATTTTFWFKSVGGRATREAVTLTHGSGNNKTIITNMMSIMNTGPHNDGFIVVADSEVIGTTKAAVYNREFKGDVTAVAIA